MIEQGNYYEFGGNTWVLRTDFLRLKGQMLERMRQRDRDIIALKSALADTEALCLQHEEVITRLTSELAVAPATIDGAGGE